VTLRVPLGAAEAAAAALAEEGVQHRHGAPSPIGRDVGEGSEDLLDWVPAGDLCGVWGSIWLEESGDEGGDGGRGDDADETRAMGWSPAAVAATSVRLVCA
jgi:hypothetical protein